jgi:hypothetical protein
MVGTTSAILGRTAVTRLSDVRTGSELARIASLRIAQQAVAGMSWLLWPPGGIWEWQSGDGGVIDMADTPIGITQHATVMATIADRAVIPIPVFRVIGKSFTEANDTLHRRFDQITKCPAPCFVNVSVQA